MSVTLTAGAEPEPTPGLLPDGRPDPAYAAALGLLPAPPGRRAAAFAIDVALHLAAAAPVLIAIPALVAQIIGGVELSLFSLVLACVGAGLSLIVIVVRLVLLGLRGVTAGLAALGIRAVSATTFDRPGFGRMLLRALLVAASAGVVPVVGAVPWLASPLWDPEKRGRGWHDRAAGAWLIDIRNGLNPADAKALRHARRQAEAAPSTAVTGLPSLASAAVQDAPFVPGPRLSSAVVGGPVAGAAPGATDAPEPSAPAPPPVPAPVTPAPVETLAPGEAFAPAETPAPQAVAKSSDGRAVITFDDGTRYQLSGTGLIGRNPSATPGESGTALLAVPDTTSSISKTHAEYGIDDGGFWIIDRASTNGTGIRDEYGAVVVLAPGERAEVPWGSAVLLGDRYFVVNRG